MELKQYYSKVHVRAAVNFERGNKANISVGIFADGGSYDYKIGSLTISDQHPNPMQLVWSAVEKVNHKYAGWFVVYTGGFNQKDGLRDTVAYEIYQLLRGYIVKSYGEWGNLQVPHYLPARLSPIIETGPPFVKWNFQGYVYPGYDSFSAPYGIKTKYADAGYHLKNSSVKHSKPFIWER